jgi:membrane protein DedA with SNARE-associated domain
MMMCGVSHLIQQYGYYGVLGIVGIESFGIPVPGETILIAASIYAGTTHKLNIIFVVLAAIVGAIVGDNLGYLVGHWGGYRLLVRYGHYIRLNQTRVKVLRYLFARHGAKVVFFGRFISILRTYAAFFAGTNRMPWPRFLLFNALGAIAWASIYGVGAYFLGNAVTGLDKPVAVGLGAAAAILVVAGFFLIRRNEKQLEEQGERAYPHPLEGYPGGPRL